MAAVRSEDSPDVVVGLAHAGAEVVEVGLLLPASEAAALEAAACRRGLTVGQAVRRLIRDFVQPPPGPPRKLGGGTDRAGGRATPGGAASIHPRGRGDTGG
jgi:hypothetical protein